MGPSKASNVLIACAKISGNGLLTGSNLADVARSTNRE